MSVPSSELAMPTPSPSLQRLCAHREGPCPLPRGTKGEGQQPRRNTRLRVGGGGGANSDDWRESLALCLLCGAGSLSVCLAVADVTDGLNFRALNDLCEWEVIENSLYSLFKKIKINYYNV